MTGDVIYRRTQIAWPTIVPLMFVAVVIVPLFMKNDFSVGLWVFAGVWALTLLLFATLTVTVTSDGVVAAFGIGLIHKTLKLADIVSFTPVRNSWLYGWGIHYFPGGVVYNASGLSAVEFKMASGSYVRIGTAEPAALSAALGQVAGKLRGVHEASTGRKLGVRHLVGIAGGIVALVVTAWTLYTGFQPPAVTLASDAFTVSNGFYRNTIPFHTIKAVTLEDDLPRIGLKTNGFAARNTLRGSFRVDRWGPSRLYVNLDVPPFVVVESADTHVVVNFADPARTRQLYADLKAHMTGAQG